MREGWAGWWAELRGTENIRNQTTPTHTKYNRHHRYPRHIYVPMYHKKRITFHIQLQFGASSPAKHDGAYFSAVYGSIKDPMAAPGLYETLEPPKLVCIATATTLFTTLAKHHGSL